MHATYLPSKQIRHVTKAGNLDSGATAHFMPESYEGGKEQKTTEGITVETLRVPHRQGKYSQERNHPSVETQLFSWSEVEGEHVGSAY